MLTKNFTLLQSSFSKNKFRTKFCEKNLLFIPIIEILIFRYTEPLYCDSLLRRYNFLCVCGWNSCKLSTPLSQLQHLWLDSVWNGAEIPLYYINFLFHTYTHCIYGVFLPLNRIFRIYTIGIQLSFCVFH